MVKKHICKSQDMQVKRYWRRSRNNENVSFNTKFNLDNINLKEQKVILQSILPILHRNVIKPHLLKMYKNDKMK